MKKALILVAAVAMGATFTSCKKEYACKCTVNGTEQTTGEFKEKKSTAEDACNELETQAKAGDPDATCSLEEK